MPAEIHPFTINVPDAELADLKRRLNQTRWPAHITDNEWSRGVNPEYLKELVRYWSEEYDWRTHEAELNKLDQFTTSIDGVNVHFVHIKSGKADATPLLLVHGWPDSFYRFHRVIPQLSTDFHIVVPSIPGFGFTGGPAMPSPAVADLFAKLMTELGYNRFAAAGGDVGAGIIKALATRHPDALSAIHLTDVGYPTGQEDPASLTGAEKQFAGFIQGWVFQEGGYVLIHSSKPLAVGAGISDSPSGLAAWMLSFINSAAENGDVEKAFGSRDELLTNLTLYWVTGTAATSASSYQEEARAMWSSGGAPTPPSTVPAGVLVAPREAQFPREWAERFVNVQRFTSAPRGGHFLQLEEPDFYVSELREFLASQAG